MVDRLRVSGKEKLIVIVVSYFDPEGQDIPNAFGLSLRDDLDIDPDELVIIKAALKHQQKQEQIELIKHCHRLRELLSDMGWEGDAR